MNRNLGSSAMTGYKQAPDGGTYYGPRRFVTTDWSLVVQAKNSDSPESRTALEELCRDYWLPLYSYARYQGLPRADAEDLTQSFFEDLLSRGAIDRADAERGRFRTFLLTSFKNHHTSQRVSADRKKRGGGKVIVSLEAIRTEESYFQTEPVSKDSPEDWFDRRWASDLVARVLDMVQGEYRKSGKAALFEELKTGIWSGGERTSYEEIGRRLGMTEGSIRVAVHRLRRRFGERMRKEVAKTVLDSADVDEEIRYLLSRLST